MGIDIEDDFEISENAKNLYLKGINNDFRKAWVKKEAYCKLLDNFDDDLFRTIDIDNLDKDYYDLSSDVYDCILFYDGKDIVIKRILCD